MAGNNYREKKELEGCLFVGSILKEAGNIA
jgi:hypothetical protein